MTCAPPPPADVPSICARLEWLLLTIAVVWLAFATYPEPQIDNDRSRWATVDSLVVRGTWAIEDSRFYQVPGSAYRIIDCVTLDGHVYSSKPPVLSFLLAGGHGLLRHVGGYRIDDWAHRRTILVVLTWAACGLPLLGLALLFRVVAGWFVADPLARLVGLAALLFGHAHLGFARTLTNHLPAAALLFACLTLALGLRHARLAPRRGWFVLCGLAAGLLPTLELPAALFCVALWLYLLRAFPRRTLLWFTLGAVPPLALHFALTWHLSGSFVPFYLRPELYRATADSYWHTPGGLDAAAYYERRATYVYHLLVGRKGLLVLYPVLLLAVAHLARCSARLGRIALGVAVPVLGYFALVAWRDNLDLGVPASGRPTAFLVFALLPLAMAAWLARGTRDDRPAELPVESLGLGALALAWVAFYAVKSTNYGGSATGLRWFLFFTPALHLLGVFTIARLRTRAQWALLCLLIGVSACSAWQAAEQPWSDNRDWPVRFLGRWLTE